jgi:glyoxylase-like metal-dependent hydrolase (beta-lactamase superfamily II)
MKSKIRRLVVGLATAACACFGLVAAASAQPPASPPAGMRLYVFSSGWLHIDKAALQSGGAGKIMVPVGFFLIHHPKGNVLFETGNNDRILTDPSYWGPQAAMLDNVEMSRAPDLAIDKQLEKAGYKTSDINYVILGHMHLDHAGNVGKFPTATIIYQRDEIVNAFWPKPGFACCYITDDFAMLRGPVGANMPSKQKVIELTGDLDLFGDGSVYIHRQVSHTPGTQMALIRLPKTGAIVLTSDVCYLPENLDKDLLPSVSLAYDPAGMLQGYQWIKRLRDSDGAQVFMAHDAEGYKQHKHSPEYYE